jgi:hypothetical protein
VITGQITIGALFCGVKATMVRAKGMGIGGRRVPLGGAAWLFTMVKWR